MITKMEVFSPQPSAPVLPLGGFMPSDDPVQVRDIQGLGPVKAEITLTQLATDRGKAYQGSVVGERNIVLALGLNPNWAEQTMSSLRQLLYAYFLPQAWTKLRFVSDHLPTCEIEGYVESFEPNMFSSDPEVQISILCPKPDFIEPEATILHGTVDNGTTQNAFTYLGTATTGFELRVEATVANPSYTGKFTITNQGYDATEIFEVNGVTVNVDKYFKLTTVRGARRVQNIDVLDGEITSLLAKKTAAAVWPELKPGENIFSLAGQENGQAWTLAYFNKFAGL